MWVAHEIDDYVFAGPLANLVERRNSGHFIRRHCRVHAACQNQSVRVDFLEDLGCLLSNRERVTADVHQDHLVALQLLPQLFPVRHGPSGEDIGVDVVLMENGPQKPQAVILPLFVRPIRVHKITQIAQIYPNNIRSSLHLRPKGPESAHVYHHLPSQDQSPNPCFAFE